MAPVTKEPPYSDLNMLRPTRSYGVGHRAMEACTRPLAISNLYWCALDHTVGGTKMSINIERRGRMFKLRGSNGRFNGIVQGTPYPGNCRESCKSYVWYFVKPTFTQVRSNILGAYLGT